VNNGAQNGEKILIIDPRGEMHRIRGLASEIRIRILNLLAEGSRNVNEIASALDLPQSTVATNIATLESAGLIRTESQKAKKGSQKLCSLAYNEIILRFDQSRPMNDDVVEVSMPIGLYTNYDVTAPCGLCTPERIIGFLDVPESFLDPERMKAGLLWFESGWVEYKFPNNSLYKDKRVTKLELGMELSSETPGTNKNLLSDITLWINNVKIGIWTSPGDFGDRRGNLTPMWWKLEGSQYGLLKHWIVTREGSFIDGVRLSGVSLDDLSLGEHSSIKVRIGVDPDARHMGGINIFGRTFGNYPQDITLRLFFT
jgi:predicted transcriptional regulator